MSASDADFFDIVTSDLVSKVFPATPVAHIGENLPYVIGALQDKKCGRALLLMALATIRAETESFLPVAEDKSRSNTSPGGNPFDLYDTRTALGNLGFPDGFRFRGRGFIQLTGRANYYRIGKVMGTDLINNPDLATDPRTAAEILVNFLLQHQTSILAALERNDLLAARKLVNGGSNGFDRFQDAFRKASELIPEEATVS